MKAIQLILILFMSTHTSIFAQPGFEGIVIEKYYIADLNDSSTPFFPVPADAVTYRVYVDMAANWELQTIFGATNSNSGEIDTLVIRSSQPFFNNEDRGRIFGYSIATNNIDENTVLLDSWFSTGRSSSLTEGVLKPEDTNGAVPGFPNLNGLLQNNDPDAGIPINISDGNIVSTSMSTWTLIGITPADFSIFDAANLSGSEFIVSNGALTSFSSPLRGPNPTNKVLIGQFTTAGAFSGQLNLQIRHTITGEIQQWVAQTPDVGQFSSPDLSWAPDQPPIVNISAPGDGTYYLSGQTVFVSADASDVDSAIYQVEFFFNAVSLGVDATAPYETSFTATINGQITAVATGDNGVQTTSAPVTIEVNPYGVGSVAQFCNYDRVCMPIEVLGAGINDVNGFDITLTFDNTMIIPTGIIVKSEDLLNPNWFSTDFTIDLLSEQMQVSVFLNGLAPPGTSFSGIGELVCVEFTKRPAFRAVDSTVIRIIALQESFAGGSVVMYDSIPPGIFSTLKNTTYLGSLAFWADNSPMVYDIDNPLDFVATSIKGSNPTCDTSSVLTLFPDLDGAFIHNLDNGGHLSIDRDIADTTDVLVVINSFDALLVRKVLIEDPIFTPSVFQLIAMDVNMDGVISAGDVTQINQRAVLINAEYKQAWNYNVNGTPGTEYARSRDWLFVSKNDVQFNPAYARSNNYPKDDGVGYYKRRVPQIPFCLWTNIDNRPEACPDVGIETFYGILLGDASGNYRYQEHTGF